MKKFNLRAAVSGYFSTLQFLIFSFTEKGSMVMPIRKVIYLFIFFTGLLFLSCNPSEPENKPTGVEFTAEDASCTEAWLTLKAANIAGVEVYRGDSLIFNFPGQSIDTTLYDDGLLPNQTYNYNLTIKQLNNKTITRSVAVQTMDTTSHNFTWQTFTFGQHSSSALYDVAIIDENNIWAVGEIYMKDSLGNPDPHAYNAVHWDGREWELLRLQFFTFCGQSHTGSYPAKGIYAFDNDNIIVSSNSQLTYIRNKKQIKTECLPVSVNKLWGSSSSDLYAVGNNGNIAHYDGSNWTKIESGTTLPINDIWGDFSKNSNTWEILAVAGNKYFDYGQEVLNIRETGVSKINKTGLPWSLSSTWFKADREYFIAGDGLFFINKMNYDWKKEDRLLPFYKDRIRGDSINNIFVSGSNGFLAHFNGYTWYNYLDNGIPYFRGRSLSVAVKNNIVVTVGWKESSAIIITGKR
ncbi:MAG: glucosyl transferase [Ignavibacteriaceae bacterium]|nr:glucosyl transferase [Ignavibacteriaceae bacterium]